MDGQKNEIDKQTLTNSLTWVIDHKVNNLEAHKDMVGQPHNTAVSDLKVANLKEEIHDWG